jgi:hypothetical protein
VKQSKREAAKLPFSALPCQLFEFDIVWQLVVVTCNERLEFLAGARSVPGGQAECVSKNG